MPDEQDKKQGFWRKLGGVVQRLLPAIEKGGARLSYAAGDREPLRLLLAQQADVKDRARQTEMDRMAAETHANQLAGFETPEQASIRRMGEFEKQHQITQKYAIPKAPQVETFGSDVMERDQATGAWKPAMREEQVPGVPSPPLMGAPVGQGPRLVRKPIKIPPKSDMSISAYEDFRKKYPQTPEGQAQAAQEWQGILKPPKPPAPEKTEGVGVPMYEDKDNPNLVTGYWFPKANKIVAAPKGGFRSKAIGSADIEATGGMETLTGQLSKLRTLAEKRPDVLGPVAGRTEWLQSVTTGGDREAANLIQLNKDIQNQLVYLLSGKQINQKEYERLKEALPDYTLPVDTFHERLNNFESRMNEVLARRKSGLGMGGGQAQPSTPPPPDNSGNWKLQRNTKTGAMRWVPK